MLSNEQHQDIIKTLDRWMDFYTWMCCQSCKLYTQFKNNDPYYSEAALRDLYVFAGKYDAIRIVKENIIRYYGEP